jgi:hypothetical protein
VQESGKHMRDLKLFKWLGLLVLMPILLVSFSTDRFRYPCQNPLNWEEPYCKRPICDVTRTCPDHIFKGQRDPRLDPQAQLLAPTNITGVACGK